MANTVIQHTFLKFDQSQKKTAFQWKPQNPRQNRKTPDLMEKNSSGNYGTTENRDQPRFSLLAIRAAIYYDVIRTNSKVQQYFAPVIMKTKAEFSKIIANASKAFMIIYYTYGHLNEKVYFLIKSKPTSINGKYQKIEIKSDCTSLNQFIYGKITIWL